MSSLVLPSRYDGVVLELTPTEHPFDGAFAVTPTWRVKLTAEGLEATLVCPESEDEPQTLADFFSQLYDERNGWDATRTWQSQGGAMRLSARHDQINTIQLSVALEGGSHMEPRWKLTGELFHDPGLFQQISANARLLGAASLASHDA